MAGTPLALLVGPQDITQLRDRLNALTIAVNALVAANAPTLGLSASYAPADFAANTFVFVNGVLTASAP